MYVNYNLLRYLPEPPIISEISKRTRKIKKMIFAILAAPAAIPPKPNKAATRAMMKNTIANRNIISSFKVISS